MTKDKEKISAWFDGEVTQQEFDAGLDYLSKSADAKKVLHQFALLSELMQRKNNLSSKKVVSIQDYAPKNNPWISNALTAAATVFVTITILYQIDSDRFVVDEERQMQLNAAVSSPEAKNQLIVADQDVMDHIIHIMQSNEPHGYQDISKDWVPVGFMPSKNNPSQYTNGRNNLFFHLENNKLGLTKVKYFQAKSGWIYLIPLGDGRLLTAYGDVPPDIASKMIQSIK
jgi:hypothetical protein